MILNIKIQAVLSARRAKGGNMTTLKQLKKGEFFTRKKIDYPNENQVFIIQEAVGLI